MRHYRRRRHEGRKADARLREEVRLIADDIFGPRAGQTRVLSVFRPIGHATRFLIGSCVLLPELGRWTAKMIPTNGT